ncbi:MAG: cysteine desulfurase family protein, partial [Minisyncoccia bacterium]
SGATESNNLAILGLVKNFKNPHIITTNIEHASVLEVCKYLEKTKQAEVTYVPVGENGTVDPVEIRKALKLNTVLVSVMYANNEIGTIQPIREIVKEIRYYKKTKQLAKFSRVLGLKPDQLENFLDASFKIFPVFHTDATQAINYLPINVEKLGIDLMSFNGSKIYGPKGVGVLFIKRKTPISKILFGGDQELGLRPGTENLVNIVGLKEALKITEKIKDKETKRLTKLRDFFIEKLYDLKNQNSKFSQVLGLGPDQLKNFNFDFLLNGDLKNRLPNNINITIPKIPSDLLVIELSARGVYVSEKSACKSGDGKASGVIKAIHPDLEETDGSLRFSLGRQTTKTDIDYTFKSLFKILKKNKRWYN